MIIVLILLTSVWFILHSKLGLTYPSLNHATATVFHEGKLSYRVSVDDNQEIVLLGGKMIIEVKENKIRVKKSDCPRQVCVNKGWISHEGERIFCLPNKTLIEMNPAKKPALDAVAF